MRNNYLEHDDIHVCSKAIFYLFAKIDKLKSFFKCQIDWLVVELKDCNDK